MSVVTVWTAIVFYLLCIRNPISSSPTPSCKVHWDTAENDRDFRARARCTAEVEESQAEQYKSSLPSVWEMGVSLWHYLPGCPRWHSELLMENHSSGPGTVRVVQHVDSRRKCRQFKQKVQSTCLWRYNGRETQKGRRIRQKQGKRSLCKFPRIHPYLAWRWGKK